ncbi:histone deacetylase family protein [Rubinisphaera margarita]|uniref:histone deacetylase family protein n=1 Tax=Rubinisphaera margarita TaxID=2909586 RepID=UPI001EE8EA86|nr:histone deacetylase [Rubinisphaera margarita]MCG6155545.1 histone deacetylase [Rubinisphaera margarita]
MPVADETTRCLYLHDERFLDHRTGSHPETSLRLKSIEKMMQPILAAADPADLRAREAQDPFNAEHREELLDLLTTVHTASYLHRLDQFAVHGGGNWDADTVVCADSYDVALLAAQTAIDAVDAVISGSARTAFCAMRPPGHHAVADSAMGFCLVNNVVVAARHAVKRHGLKRVLIVDWDVHHGNGTQDLVYEDEQIWFFSAHRWPFYPGTGAAEETGTGKGLGTIRNLPLPANTTPEQYLKAFEETLGSFADKCRPELVLISAGFDAHRLDPIGSLNLDTEDFGRLTRFVGEIARTHAKTRIVSLLEGGYDRDALAASVRTHVETLSSADLHSDRTGN